jgi:hypothetical protein
MRKHAHPTTAGSSNIFQHKITLEKYPVGNTFLDITLSGSKKETIEAVHYLYSLYRELDADIQEMNQRTFSFTQNTLQNLLEQKKTMLAGYLPAPQPDQRSDNFLEGDYAENAGILSSEIARLQQALELNSMVEPLEGAFQVKTSGMAIDIHENNLQTVPRYVTPVSTKSMKRRLLPAVIAVFLALILGIFLAFVVEFFSRDDVRKRLKEAAKKSP